MISFRIKCNRFGLPSNLVRTNLITRSRFGFCLKCRIGLESNGMEEKIFLKNKAGLKLAAVLHKPNGEGKFPAAILLHGFTGYKEEGHIEEMARDLARKGIGAVRFDASGYGESEGTLDHDYRFSNYMTDTQLVFDYLSKLDWVDKSRMGVCGQSMGGIQAILLASNNPQIKAVVAISAPTKMGSTDDLKGKYSEWKRVGYTERISSRFGKIRVPYAFIEDASKWDALDYVGKISCPVLVIWGTKDVNVTAGSTKQIFDKANEPKESWEVEGMDHYPKRSPELLKKIIEKVVDFFNASLE